MTTYKNISILLVLFPLCFHLEMQAQQQTKDFKTTINELKGFEYRNVLDVPFGLKHNGTIIIDNLPDYNIVIDDYKKDSTHVLILTKLISIDSTKPRSKPVKEKIFDVITVTFDDNKMVLWTDIVSAMIKRITQSLRLQGIHILNT